ncbi:MAG: patatin-like phospholipase family protein [Arenicellales bacterium]|nr:patatin-like phospholipase family protein [Arenicellales bacterium]
MKKVFHFLTTVTLTVSLMSCASYPVNDPLEKIDTDVGYRLNNRTLGPKNSDELFVIVGLSGGGTRAAALDYGVLEYLERVRFGDDNRSLLDEIDIISTSSAASIPAAYYGLFGKEVFLNDFVEDVLYRKTQSGLAKRMLNPVHWPRLMSGTFSRGDLAVEYFDREIFHGNTFADMHQERPLILLNATDMGIGSQFSFVQSNFDLLCSDLSSFLVARAVTASLSFTPAFTPITLKNYNDRSCGYSTPNWVRDALEAGLENDPSVYAAARDVVSYENLEKRPYIHLLDSGISDNIGIRSPALIFSIRDSPASQIDRIEDGTIKKLVVILVDAKPKTHFKGDLKPKPPSAITSVQTAASRPLANYSYETVNLLKRDIRETRNELERYHRQRKACDVHAKVVCTQIDLGGGCYERVRDNCFEKFKVSDSNRPLDLDIYIIHVSFELIEDKARRDRFQAIPTKLQLPEEDIDLLIDLAPELINEEPEFHHLVQDLDARIVN